jgi:glutaredoxin
MENSTQTSARTKCEIWTRVMGYHRPVSQYNFGKKSEFYSRVYFDSLENENQKLTDKYADKNISEKAVADKMILFTTKACPKCPAVKTLLENSETNYFAIDDSMLNFMEMADKYSVRSVPTLMAVDQNGGEIWRASDLSEIAEIINGVKC